MALAPQGFKDETNGIYSASTFIETTRNTQQRYKFKVNNITGNIDIYEPTQLGDKLFYRFNASTGKWGIPTDVDGATSTYINTIRNIGEPGSKNFDTLLSTAKLGANKVILETSSSSNKEEILNTPGYKSQGNAATDSGGASQEGGNVPAPTQEDYIILSNLQIGTPQVAGSFKDWRYPQGLTNQNQDVITFTMREYTAPSGLDNLSGGTLKGRRKQKGTTLGIVTLPIQPTITDSNSVNWEQDKLNPIELAGLELSSSIMDRGVSGGTDALDNIIRTLGTENENLGKAVLAGFSGLAIGKNVLARTTGAILNPNIELLFNGPSLRVFNYRFQLSAREKDESKQIQGIIRFFKKGMAVRRSAAELFLVTPNIFEIKYLHKDNDHPYINRIKTCALTNCSVDYTPTGSYMTFPDGSMVSYAINLTFEELEPIYQDDYDTEKGGGGVGF
jgi:hypothetical protein